MSVLGRKKWTFLRTFRVLRETEALSALETLAAFLLDWGFSAWAAASAFAFLGAMAVCLNSVALRE